MNKTDNLSEKIPLNVNCIRLLNCELVIATDNCPKTLPGSLPNTLEKITIYNRLNEYALPSSVRTMYFNCDEQQFIPRLFLTLALRNIFIDDFILNNMKDPSTQQYVKK
ncbi:hypothetical protein PPL_11251 [Heterostelium album PN500]|uniref:Uncharacterized protein n=1 Tax=Heterostelium pallidum (strain ATCC 26659 / Pp 5 / PN500) TaxID=670386 RepID=D3BTZ1_HETP5|nr:hypothetical protein PPL_11251 [Heterostelium album PN500]EFA75177.1 hypothetical protein PPL_11251 [Heterostelium album PN500]|eukprot:XP_020427311.1 hypothetical protein PPL_11251 [Heterostelium album PN500]